MESEIFRSRTSEKNLGGTQIISQVKREILWFMGHMHVWQWEWERRIMGSSKPLFWLPSLLPPTQEDPGDIVREPRLFPPKSVRKSLYKENRTHIY